MYNKNKGYEYEKVAKNYLISNGYEILEVNFNCRFGEIDIIATKDRRLHFIEVKGRVNTDYGYPRESVTIPKQRRIIMAANYYFMIKGSDDVPCQFDVIEIIIEKKEINFIENAFQN